MPSATFALMNDPYPLVVTDTQIAAIIGITKQVCAGFRNNSQQRVYRGYGRYEMGEERAHHLNGTCSPDQLENGKV